MGNLKAKERFPDVRGNRQTRGQFIATSKTQLSRAETQVNAAGYGIFIHFASVGQNT